MIDHVGLKVKSFRKSFEFYSKALAPLGYKVLAQYEGGAGFGAGKGPDFWIGESDRPTANVHVAFQSRRRAPVDQFHKAALQAGGKDTGAPGVRKDYHPDYYGAFVLDPDGNNIEAVCHDPKG